MKSRPNFSAISSRHLRVSPAGQTTMMRRARWRSSSSWATRPASMVLPRPTSSASSRLTRGASTARATGSSWYSSTATPERNGACSVLTSAEVTADQRTASRNAASRCGESNPPADLGQGAGRQYPPARLDLPDDVEGVAVAAVLDALQADQAAVLAGLDVADHPPLAAHGNQSTDRRLVRRCARGCGRHRSPLVETGCDSLASYGRARETASVAAWFVAR